jgi:Xaa-Pro aminopeptidase
MSGYGICSAGIHSLAGTKFEGVCSGQGVSAAVPYGAVPLEIPRNTPVILDYAFNLEGYHVDQTRMFCWGEPGDDFRAAFEAMLKIEEAVVTMLRPGVKWDSLYEKSVTLAGEYGYEGVFMGAGTEKVRFVGHGVGLELDELPLLAEKMDQPLEEGMVIAVEPKVALPGVGIIGIEDTYVVRSAGAELLTDCPKEIIVSHR